MSMARGEVQGPALRWMGHHGAQQRNRKEAVSQTPGTLPPDGCHHRRAATTGDKSRGMAVFGPLRLALEPLAIPLSRLRTQPQGWGRLLQWDIASRAGEVGARHLPRDPPPHPLSLLEGFRPWQQSKRGESTFPSSLSSEGREPGPLDPDASTWPRTIGTSSACSLLANPHHLFPSFPRQARNQSSRGHR